MWYSSNGGATWADIYIPTTRNQSWQFKGIFSGPETTVYPPGTYPIAGIVQNYGVTFTETDFTVNAKVYKLGARDTLVYEDNVTVTDDLAPGISAAVSFEDITIENVTAAEGNYRVEITTMLPNDDHTNNDKKKQRPSPSSSLMCSHQSPRTALAEQWEITTGISVTSQ